MQTLHSQTPRAVVVTPPPVRAPDNSAWKDLCRPVQHTRMQFEAMCISYAATGGIGRVEDVVDRFMHHDGPRTDLLASWIERREVICFEWEDGIWLPWFQFHRVELRPHPGLDAVFTELIPVFDAWEMAIWFARPNAWLAFRTPVATLVSDLAAVRDAARTDRFIANG